MFVLHVWCEEKSIVLAYIFINSILFVYLSTVQNNLLPFQFILYSIILSLLMRHCHEWLNIFATVWESIDKRYVLCSNMTYPLMRYLMIFVISSLLLASLTPLEKNFRYDSFKLHMLMVAVWWYYFSIVEFYKWIGKSAGKIGLWGDIIYVLLSIGEISFIIWITKGIINIIQNKVYQRVGGVLLLIIIPQ